ncbi:ABC-2 transporter permease [Arabiibacter massiliensis]|uniref:ABC-2 transporter permease n=1 Tax=Arabiibacter massiliensis TaxID=1870985 RepID=UPI0009BB081C|nr:ABC-2 transporter permease [Arabiibacter massiliensis]
MLGKLFKHDMAALSRVLVPLHLAALGVAVLAAVCGLAGNGLGEAARQATGVGGEMLSLFAGFAYVAFGFSLFLLCTLTLATFFVVAHRFYRNLFTDEGYLTFTLPVTANQIVLSKTLSGALWLLIDFLVVGVCITAVMFGMDAFSSMLSQSYSFGGGPQLPSAGEWANFANTCLQAIAWMLAAYAALCVGSAAARHKVAAAVGAFLLIGMAVGIASALLNAAAFMAISTFAPGLWSAHFDPYGPVSRAIGQLTMLALAAASYAVCVWCLKRHVNLA